MPNNEKHCKTIETPKPVIISTAHMKIRSPLSWVGCSLLYVCLSTLSSTTAHSQLLRTINFEEVSPNDSSDANYGPTYLTPQNFLFKNFDLNGQPRDIRIWNPALFYTTTTSSEAIINSYGYGTTSMTENSGALFSVISLDISSSFSRSVTFTGTLFDGSTVFQSVTTPGNGYQYTNVVFVGFTDLMSFGWGQQSNSVDNIVVSVVPEPGTFALLGASVLILAIVRMCRSTDSTRIA